MNSFFFLQVLVTWYFKNCCVNCFHPHSVVKKKKKKKPEEGSRQQFGNFMQTCFSLILSLLCIQHIFGVYRHCCSCTQIKMVVPLIRLNQDSFSLFIYIVTGP